MKKVVNIAYDSLDSSQEKATSLIKMNDRYGASSDPEIWSALKDGDQEALGYVYNEYIQHLYRFGYQLTRDKETIGDCVQDIFISIGRNKESQGTVQSIKSYLFKALYREVMYKIKKSKSIQLTESFEDASKFSIDINIESHLINEETVKEKLEKVHSELNNLSGKQRQVILHYFYDGFTYDEIAEIMGIQHKNTVAKLIKRALDMLRKNVALSVLLLTTLFHPPGT